MHPRLDLVLNNWKMVESCLTKGSGEINIIKMEGDQSINSFVLFCLGYSSLTGVYGKSLGKMSFEYILDRFPFDLYLSFLLTDKKKEGQQINELIKKISNEKIQKRSEEYSDIADEYLTLMESAQVEAKRQLLNFEKIEKNENVSFTDEKKLDNFDVSVLRKLREIAYSQDNGFPDFFMKYFFIIDRLIYWNIEDSFFTFLKKKFKKKV